MLTAAEAKGEGVAGKEISCDVGSHQASGMRMAAGADGLVFVAESILLYEVTRFICSVLAVI